MQPSISRQQGACATGQMLPHSTPRRLGLRAKCLLPDQMLKRMTDQDPDLAFTGMELMRFHGAQTLLGELR